MSVQIELRDVCAWCKTPSIEVEKYRYAEDFDTFDDRVTVKCSKADVCKHLEAQDGEHGAA